MRFERSIGHRLLGLSPSSSPGSLSPDLPPSGTAASSAISISTMTFSYNLFELIISLCIYIYIYEILASIFAESHGCLSEADSHYEVLLIVTYYISV